MRRRELVAGAAGLVVAGGGAAVAFGDLDLGGDDHAVEPVELETIDAPGSAAGTTLVPEPGRVTFLELFATWCDVCERMMPQLAAVHDEVGEDVQFVSVTNEPVGVTVTRDHVAEWWADNGGNWTVAVDRELELTERLDVAASVPYAFVLDESNVVVWSDRGYKSADELREAIETATLDD